jgi:hypothetical protein
MESNPTFDQWLRWVFEHPVADPAWHWEASEWLEPTSAVALDYLTTLFSRPNVHLPQFDDAQVNQGLNLLMSPSCSDHFFCFLDSELPLEKRLTGIRSFIPLFTDYFAARCSAHLSSLDEKGAAALNAACYMWWDVSPFSGDAKQSGAGAETLSPCLKVMEAALATTNIACQESALHGLGHFANYDAGKAECQRLIDRFLANATSLRPELVEYAKMARGGHVR